MKYEFKVLKNDWLVMEFKNNADRGILTCFLADGSISYKNRDKYLNEIDKVLNGKKQYVNLGGEAHDVHVEKEKITIYFEYVNEEEDPELIIATKEFREIMIAWFDRVEEFKENKR